MTCEAGAYLVYMKKKTNTDGKSMVTKFNMEHLVQS